MSSERWTAAALPDLSGRTVVVTGASSGLGAVTARELARSGAKVVLAVRDVAKGQAVAATVTGETEVRRLDLGSLASVREFADAWTGDLDILINNAGIMQAPEGRTVDGFELHIGTNHLGPFALTTLLLPHITDRVVTVSSGLHAAGHLDLADLNWDSRPYNSMQAYRDSKLANLLFTFELQRHLEAAGSNIRALAVHPGVARTNLVSHVGGVQGAIYKGLGRIFMLSPDHGALPTLYAATQDIVGGSYVGPNGFAHVRGYPEIERAAPAAYDDELARGLWDLSARLTNPDTTATPVRVPSSGTPTVAGLSR